MYALVVENGHLHVRSDLPTPTRAPGEALVRVRLAGICATDLEVVKGYAGFHGVLGHEFVGQVAASDDPAWHGRRVVGAINVGCGQCDICRRHGPAHCRQRQALGIHGKDGAFADYLTLPVENLLPVPENVPDEAAVFTEPLAAAVRIREQIPVRPSWRTAVIGPGRLGLLVAQVLALAGTEVTILGRRIDALQLPASWGLATGLAAEFPDGSFDLVVEATGNEAGFAQALRLIRPLGTLVLKSTFHGGSRLDLTRMVVSEITVIGSRCGPFAPALRLLAHNQVEVQALIDAEYALQDGVAAFEHAARPGVRKVLLRPSRV